MTVGRRRAALSTLFGNGTTVLITVVQAFVLLPLCLEYLGAALYGAWLGASELLLWLQLLDLGIPNLMTQRIGASTGRSDTRDAGLWSSTGLWLLAGIGVLLSAIAIAAAPAVTVWARVPAADAAAFTASFRIGAIASALLLVYHGTIGIARGIQVTGLISATQITGAAVGLAVAASLLVAGAGIWALAIGLLARGAVGVAGGALFLLQARRAGLRLGRPSLAVLREIGALAPSTGAANAGYLLATYTDVLLVTTIFGPVAAAVYGLTRRAMDGVRTLLESIAAATYGGFAHLVTADDRYRSRGVLHQILALRLAAAALCGAVILGVNQMFVTLLFGSENFGGLWLTTGFAVQMVISGQALLANYMLRAAGNVAEGSLLLAGEAIARLAAVAGALLTTGLVGAPWAATVVSTAALVVTLRWLDRTLPAPRTVEAPARLRTLMAAAVVLALGFAVAAVGVPQSWTSVVLAATLLSGFGAVALWCLLPAAVSGGSLLRWTRT